MPDTVSEPPGLPALASFAELALRQGHAADRPSRYVISQRLYDYLVGTGDVTSEQLDQVVEVYRG
ncbi:hypothetical protein SEA_BIGGITYBASS_70 [Gordonia phage BiggityBass]|nr:hypothetical protein SEA_BIGGITYBASS_70 [Gordonia phage BiggityBass]